jgi:hypothetical protein
VGNALGGSSPLTRIALRGHAKRHLTAVLVGSRASSARTSLTRFGLDQADHPLEGSSSLPARTMTGVPRPLRAGGHVSEPKEVSFHVTQKAWTPRAECPTWRHIERSS